MSDNKLQKGLKNVTVAETRLSYIDGKSGELVIAGFPLSEIANNASYEEALYLLYNDSLPSKEELETFEEKLTDYRSIPKGCLDVIRAAAEAEKPPMDALRMGAAAVNLDLDGEDVERDSLALVSRFPTIVAAYWRFRNDEEFLEPREDLSHAGNYLYMLTGEEPTDAQVRGIEAYLITVIDHGLNASTFTSRTIVSTESDLFSAVTGAIGALKGPLHGGAPGPVLDMLLKMKENGDVESQIRESLESGERLMGFGHRVYKTRDPRAEVLSTAAREFYQSDEESEFIELAMEVEDVATELLEEYKPGRQLETNVEFYTAVLLHGIGVPAELFTTTFAIARVGGWTAHCQEQLEDNRLIRPLSRYTSEKNRSWSPIEGRFS